MKPLDHCPGLSNNLSGAHLLQRPPRNVGFLLIVSQTAKKTMKISSITRKRYHAIDTIGFVPRHLLATGTSDSLIHKRHLISTDVPHNCMRRNWERLRVKYGGSTLLFTDRLG